MTEPEALMRTVTAAFEKGDLQPLFASIHDKIVWKAASQHTDLFRFGGTYADRAGIKDVTSRIASAYTFHRFAPKEIISSGDTVWGLFDMEAEFRPTGKPTASPKHIKLEFALRWRVQNGKIVEHQAFFDTASLLAQQGNLSVTSDELTSIGQQLPE